MTTLWGDCVVQGTSAFCQMAVATARDFGHQSKPLCPVLGNEPREERWNTCSTGCDACFIGGLAQQLPLCVRLELVDHPRS